MTETIPEEFTTDFKISFIVFNGENSAYILAARIRTCTYEL